MRFRILIILMLVALITVGCSSTSTLSEEEKLADFEQLYNGIEEGYPFLEVSKRQNKQDWLANKESYKKYVMDSSSDQKFADKLNNIVGELHNGHTDVINNKDWFNNLEEIYEPLGWYDFFDDEDVNTMYDSLRKGNKNSNGNEDFSDIELKDLVENKIGYIHIPQMNSAKGTIDDDMKRIATYLEKIQNYDSLVIDIRGNLGGDDEYWIKLVSLLTDKTYKCKGYRLFRNNSDIIDNYTKVRNVKLNNISQLPKDVFKNAPKEVTTMFTDFEYNEEIVEGKSKNPFKGKLYLFVDDKVFSAAESFSIFCKEQNFATIIGTRTLGDGYIYDPVLFKLDNSGLLVRMSSVMYLTESGICDEEEKVTPDIKIESTKANQKPKLDDYVDKVLEIEKVK